MVDGAQLIEYVRQVAPNVSLSVFQEFECVLQCIARVYLRDRHATPRCCFARFDRCQPDRRRCQQLGTGHKSIHLMIPVPTISLHLRVRALIGSVRLVWLVG